MAKVVDITDKLYFGENPKLMIKGEEIEVNSDAPTLIKVMGKVSGDPGMEEVVDAYNLIFPEESREKLVRLGLKFNGLMTVIQEAIALVTDDTVEEGNAQTRTTT